VTLLEWPARIRDFLSHKLWEIEPERRSRLSALRLLQFSIMLGEGFIRDHLLLRASALTYFTVLSVVPLLGVVVAIASAVGVSSRDFVDWVVATFAGGAPEAEETIRALISNVDFTGLGKLGAGVLLVTTVLAIGNVESTLNHIWGVARGRSWARRFSDYLAVIVVAPILGGIALSLAASLQSQWAIAQLTDQPALSFLIRWGKALVPAGMLSVAFTFLYWFLPNTRVRFVSAAIGGVFAGFTVTVAQNVYVQWSVGAARADAFFGGFYLIPLLFAWIYLFWAIVLFGAEIGFAHQNFALYRQEVRGDPASAAERESIGLRIALDVARRFRAGGPPAHAAGLAEDLQVPVRTVRSVTQALQDAGILSRRVDRESDEVLQLGRPADIVKVTDVLEAVRGHRAPLHGAHAIGDVAKKLLDRMEAAAGEAAGGRTLADLLAEPVAVHAIDPSRTHA
jgi:membrane protein